MCDRDISSHSVTVNLKEHGLLPEEKPKGISPKEDIAMGREIAALTQKNEPDESDGKYQVLKRTR